MARRSSRIFASARPFGSVRNTPPSYSCRRHLPRQPRRPASVRAQSISNPVTEERSVSSGSARPFEPLSEPSPGTTNALDTPSELPLCHFVPIFVEAGRKPGDSSIRHQATTVGQLWKQPNWTAISLSTPDRVRLATGNEGARRAGDHQMTISPGTGQTPQFAGALGTTGGRWEAGEWPVEGAARRWSESRSRTSRSIAISPFSLTCPVF